MQFWFKLSLTTSGKADQNHLLESSVKMYAKFYFFYKFFPISNHFRFLNAVYESPKFCYILFLTYHFSTTDFCIVLRCMVHGYAFYIAVVVPVSTILLANTVALIIVMYNLYQHSQEKARKLSDGDKNKKPMTDTAMIISQTRIAFACNVLLGITWIFALLAVGKATLKVHQHADHSRHHQEVSGAPLLSVTLLETLKHLKYSGCFSVTPNAHQLVSSIKHFLKNH